MTATNMADSILSMFLPLRKGLFFGPKNAWILEVWSEQRLPAEKDSTKMSLRKVRFPEKMRNVTFCAKLLAASSCIQIGLATIFFRVVKKQMSINGKSAG